MGLFDGIPSHLKDERFRALCFHEAAHAVAGLVLDIRFGEARIYHSQKGRVEGGELGPGTTILDRRPRAWCVFAAAGLAGELLWLARNELDVLEPSARDWAEGDTQGIQYWGRPRGVDPGWARAQAQTLVTANYTQITALAASLHQHRRLALAASRAAAGATSTTRVKERT